MKNENMQAGREIDELVAKQVMNLKQTRKSTDPLGRMCLEYFAGMTSYEECDWKEQKLWLTVPYFSTDISSAWAVMEKLSEEQVTQLSHYNVVDKGWQWVASCGYDWASADTAPLAICQVALVIAIKNMGK